LKKKGLHRVFAWSPKFRVDPSGRLVFFGSIASPNLEWNRNDQYYWVLLVAWPNAARSWWHQGPPLLGPTSSWPQMLLGLVAQQVPATLGPTGQQDPLLLGLAAEPCIINLGLTMELHPTRANATRQQSPTSFGHVWHKDPAALGSVGQ